MLSPDISRLRLVTKDVAHAVAGKAIEAGQSNASIESVDEHLETDMWDPDYPEINAD